MDEIYNGYGWTPETGEIGGKEPFDLSSHMTMISPTGSSKGVSIEIPNLLLGLRNSTVFNPDPSGQNAAVCAAVRASRSRSKGGGLKGYITLISSRSWHVFFKIPWKHSSHTRLTVEYAPPNWGISIQVCPAKNDL
jgi:hypothetical protein